MTRVTFASVAIFRRDGKMTFRAPLKRSYQNLTQARKSAARIWMGAIRSPDKLTKVMVARMNGQSVDVSERIMIGPSTGWTSYTLPTAEAMNDVAIAACVRELGVDPAQAPPAMPDVLEINGCIYRREI